MGNITQTITTGLGDVEINHLTKTITFQKILEDCESDVNTDNLTGMRLELENNFPGYKIFIDEEIYKLTILNTQKELEKLRESNQTKNCNEYISKDLGETKKRRTKSSKVKKNISSDDINPICKDQILENAKEKKTPENISCEKLIENIVDKSKVTTPEEQKN